MHTKAPHEPPDPKFNWEVRDLPVGSIAKAVFWFYMLVVITAPLCIWIMGKMGGNVLSEGPGHYDSRRLPDDPYPLLQDSATASVDMHNLRRAEKKTLETEGTEPGGKPRITLEKAIDLEAKRVGR